jgi:DNA polymerase-3 subunit gamma/tau
MALALYRKYRPRTFAEVIGQEQVTEPLTQALRTGRLNHAYLFSGPRGCGKTSSARILARSLNCEKGPTPEPCGVCESCVALAPDGPGSLDVIEIDAASHGGVDDARDLRERAFFAPVTSRFKVYVIDEAHMVSTQGFNALLKLVEEPPEYVKFVFATTEPEKVLGTIKSRTHHYPFRLVPPSVLRPYLEKLAREEGVTVEPAVFPLVVRAGGGSIRDSLSVLDQLIAGAGASGVTYARAVGLLGVTDVALIDEMTDALAAGDGAAAFATIDRVAEAGHDPRRYTSDLLERFRDLIIMQKVPDAAANGIIEAPDDQLERMTAQASRMGPATLSRLADIVHNGLTEMRGTTAPRLLLELLVARMLLPGAEAAEGALLQRLERMERRLGASEAAVEPAVVRVEPAVASAAPVATKPKPEPAARTPEPPVRVSDPPQETVVAPAEPGSLDAAAVRRVWDEVLTTIRRRSPKAWAVVREAVVRDVHGEELVLVFQHSVHANMFGAQAELLLEAVHEVFGGTWRVRAEVGGESRPAPAPAAAPPAPAPDRSSDDGDWPAPARLGGDAPARPAEGSAPPARPASPARPAAEKAPRSRPAAPKRAESSRTPPARPATSRRNDAQPPDEPPFDPDYDRVASYEGFDPGDEPLDDAVDPALARQSSEEKAIALLTEQLGAERIGGDPPN